MAVEMTQSVQASHVSRAECTFPWRGAAPHGVTGKSSGTFTLADCGRASRAAERHGQRSQRAFEERGEAGMGRGTALKGHGGGVIPQPWQRN